MKKEPHRFIPIYGLNFLGRSKPINLYLDLAHFLNIMLYWGQGNNQ